MRTAVHESPVRSRCVTLRYGLVVLAAVAAFGCNGDSVPITDSGNTSPPREPGYSLTLSGPLLSSAQGWSPLPMTVSLLRTAFTGSVALSVENLPMGVSAYFSPTNPLSGNYSELFLNVGREAPTGTFSNLLVRGVATGLPDRTAPLALTITAAPITVGPLALTLSSSNVTVMQGTTTTTTTVSVIRDDYAGPVTLWADIGDFHGTMPRGVTAAFEPNRTTGNSSVLTVSVSGAAMPGAYDLWIFAEATPGWYFEGPILRLTITAAPPL
jgi:hypothetical protein